MPVEGRVRRRACRRPRIMRHAWRSRKRTRSRRKPTILQRKNMFTFNVHGAAMVAASLPNVPAGRLAPTARLRFGRAAASLPDRAVPELVRATVRPAGLDESRHNLGLADTCDRGCAFR